MDLIYGNYANETVEHRVLIWPYHFDTTGSVRVPLLKPMFRIHIGFSADPGPALLVHTDLDSDSVFWWLKTVKNLQLKIFFYFLGIKNYNLPIPRPPLRTSKLQKKHSVLKRKHPALQNMKFRKKILLLWASCALLDPDPLTWLNPDSIGIRNPGWEALCRMEMRLRWCFESASGSYYLLTIYILWENRSTR